MFQTSDLPPAERFAAWQAGIGIFLQVRLLKPSDDEGFDAWAERHLMEDNNRNNRREVTDAGYRNASMSERRI